MRVHYLVVLLLIVVLYGLLALTSIRPSHAGGVGSACVKDYFKHCSHTMPYSANCRACFKAVGRGLSRPCLDALRVSGAYGAEFRRERRRYIAGN